MKKRTRKRPLFVLFLIVCPLQQVVHADAVQVGQGAQHPRRDHSLAALESGKVRAAGLDVYADEPATNKALYSHPMVSCTPHIGAATVEAQKRIGAEIVDII